MSRRRTFLSRPLESLHAAAQTHKRLVAGEEEPGGAGAGQPAAHAEHTERRRRKRQARDTHGRFT